MKRPLKLYWKYSGKKGSGPSYGYRIHTEHMINALSEKGVVNVFNPDEKYDLAIHICAPYQFKAIPGRKNLIFSMCESTNIPKKERPNELGRADLMVTPTQFSADEYSKYFDIPFYTCPEGISPQEFPFYPRTVPSKNTPFMFFWNGASNLRKGPHYIWKAWCAWEKSGRLPDNAWLVFKTSIQSKNDNSGGRSVSEKTRVILDSRNLSVIELNEVYQSANCFLYPSEGEGWGLGLGEAAATGLPCIYTNVSAMKYWFPSEAGYPLNQFRLRPSHKIHRDELLNIASFHPAPPKVRPPSNKNKKTRSTMAIFAQPDIEELFHTMEHVYNNYHEALERGRKASERMHSQFTWDCAAARFIEICEDFMSGTR